MSDISLHFSPIDWIVAAAFFGWPGLLLGAAAGALLWKRRRFLGGALGAAVGCLLWFAVSILTL